MKIIRDGKEIELTSDELFLAYQEQERLFDIQNIEDNMSGGYLKEIDEDEYEALRNNKEAIEYAADVLRRNQDKTDMDYDHALEDAFKMMKRKYLKEAEL